MRGRGPFSGNVGLLHWRFRYRPNWLSVCSVENIGKRLLPGLRNSLDRPSVDIDVDQDRRRRHVVVPDVVMNQLLVPDPFTCLDIDTHQRIREEIRAGPVAAIEVVGRIFDVEIRVAKFVVGGERSPHACVA